MYPKMLCNRTGPDDEYGGGPGGPSDGFGGPGGNSLNGNRGGPLLL